MILLQKDRSVYSIACTGKSHQCPDNDLDCKNGGVCEIKHDVPYCVCPDGYEGLLCNFIKEDNQSKAVNLTGRYFFDKNWTCTI